MRRPADNLLASLAVAARRQPLWHVTAPPWLASILVAGGAHRATAPDATTVSAFDEFFRDEYRSFVKAVMFAGASLDDAEDAVSAAMIEAYLSWPLLANPVAWVRTAAVHHFINSAQRNRRRPILEVQAARRDRVDVAATQPGEEPDERSQVLMALRGLPSAQRSVMALALDGHEPAEIAEMLGVQPANVRSNLRHARERLRHSLAVVH